MSEFNVIVPHKNMTAERAIECNEIMVKGNTAYRKWMPFFSRLRSRTCRAAIIKGDLNEVLQYIPSERRGEFIADVPDILHVETVMTDVVGHYVKMVCRLAMRWEVRNRAEASAKKSYIGVEDIVSEGFLAMFDAIRNYDRIDIRFLTYAWTTVNRRMFEAIIESAPIACFTKREQKLFNTVVSELLKDGRSVTEAVEEGSLPKKNAAVVEEIMSVKVRSASSITKNEDSNDFTSLRRISKTSANDVWELYELIERAGLTSFEKDVVLSSMSPFHGWQAECAKRHTNSQTGKQITRAGVRHALQNACDKIRLAAGCESEQRNVSAIMKSTH